MRYDQGGSLYTAPPSRRECCQRVALRAAQSAASTFGTVFCGTSAMLLAALLMLRAMGPCVKIDVTVDL